MESGRSCSELYANLEVKNLGLIKKLVRGAVMRAYAADGTEQGEGIVIELPHRGVGSTEASFHVSVEDGMTGEGEVKSGEVKADYAFREGERIDTYAIKGGQMRLTESGRTGVG